MYKPRRIYASPFISLSKTPYEDVEAQDLYYKRQLTVLRTIVTLTKNHELHNSFQALASRAGRKSCVLRTVPRFIKR